MRSSDWSSDVCSSDLVEACVATGTDYADLCGEPGWMREKIDQHHEAAKASGARICFSSGFDSIPFDLGVLMTQNEAQARLGEIGRAVCRERGCPYVELSVGAVDVTQKTQKKH